MHDPMTIFDQRQASEAHALVNKRKAEAMRMIEEMSDTAFLKFWERHAQQMDSLAAERHGKEPITPDDAIPVDSPTRGRNKLFKSIGRK